MENNIQQPLYRLHTKLPNELTPYQAGYNGWKYSEKLGWLEPLTPTPAQPVEDDYNELKRTGHAVKFATWYSGMGQEKVIAAYNRWLNEKDATPAAQPVKDKADNTAEYIKELSEVSKLGSNLPAGTIEALKKKYGIDEAAQPVDGGNEQKQGNN
jgi:hypothetical protein